ncbi:uncharacterized protein DSM5745_11380 [Aspergillus mulundensis]|uniref:Uncharacterized protein n=1 Tax=Aspergillus mulundensis TaxID=1810919 RepID=A0A3D8Q7R7_9EURO|nr:Uncharacterized protein DSM5745_11380 [Aspergillus mulundensis]RDW57862.1 Uncharacterized protein DSM5745_11380 [Aspergillus mulundensis]
MVLRTITTRRTAPVLSRSRLQLVSHIPRRFAATKESSPGHSSNAKNPLSSGGASQSINLSRGKEARSSDMADTRSVQSPISSSDGPTSEAHAGEEQTEADSLIKNDPAKSGAEKRANVERAGRRKLGPEDDQ